jgi:hypothetical protein
MAIERTAEAIAPSTPKIEMMRMFVYVRQEIQRVETSQCLEIARVNTLSAGKNQGIYTLSKLHSRIPRVDKAGAAQKMASVVWNKNAGYSSPRKITINRSCSRPERPN